MKNLFPNHEPKTPTHSGKIIVVVCLPRPVEGRGDSKFQMFSQNCQFHHRRLESLEHFKCAYYIILSTTVSSFGPKDAILFFTILLLLMCTFPVFLHVRYAFNVICRILLMTDGLNAV